MHFHIQEGLTQVEAAAATHLAWLLRLTLPTRLPFLTADVASVVTTFGVRLVSRIRTYVLRPYVRLYTTVSTSPSFRRQLASLHQSLAQDQADDAFDTFMRLAKQDAPALTTTEFRGILRVLLDRRPHTPTTTDRVLFVMEQLHRAFHTYTHRPLSDPLVRHEWAELLQDAYIWNALLTSARSSLHASPAEALADLLDLFFLASATASVSASADIQPSLTSPSYAWMAGYAPVAYRLFPDTISFNILLHTLVRNIGASPPPVFRRSSLSLRTMALLPSQDTKEEPTLPIAMLRTIRQRLSTEAGAPSFLTSSFESIWAWMEQHPTCTPSRISWCIRLSMYVRLRRWDEVRSCMATMTELGMCSTHAVNTVLQAYMQSTTDEAPTRSTHLRHVYEALRFNALCTARDALSSHPPVTAAAASATAAAESALSLGQVLGIDALPRTIVPDRATYALVVRGLAEAGDLDGALHVMHDMVVTPEHPDDLGMKPTMDIYHTLFQGFAHFGVGAQYRTATQTWSVSDTSPWNIHALEQLLEGYLRLEPTSRFLPASDESLSPSSQLKMPATLAPSPRALASLLAALRKVSRSHRRYMTRQWARIAAKFQAPPWHGWRIDRSLQRTLSMLGIPTAQRSPQDEEVGA